MPKAVLTFSGTTPTYDAVLEFQIPRYSGIDENYSNIRFLDMNGRELPYWIEHDENGKKNGYCYVKVPWIGENGISIVMVWGTGVKGRENGDEVFLLFDDFDGTTLDAAKWDSGCGSAGGDIVVDNGILMLQSNVPSSGGTGCAVWSIDKVDNFEVVAWRKQTDEHYADITWNLDQAPSFSSTHGTSLNNIGFYIQSPVSGYDANDVYIYKKNSGSGTIVVNQNGQNMITLNFYYRQVASYINNQAHFQALQHGFPGWDLTGSIDDFVNQSGSIVLWQGRYQNGDGGASYFDWVLVYSPPDPRPRLLTIYPLLPTTIYILLSSAEVIKHLLGIDIVTSFDSVIDVTANEGVSDLNATNNLTSTTVVNLFSELLNSIHDVSKVSSSSGTSFVRVSLRTWNDYITHDPVTWAVKQLNNTAEVIAKDGSILETLSDTTTHFSTLSTSGYVIISLKDTIRILEDITNALEYAILHPELVINSQQIKNKLVAVEAIAIFAERISYFIKEVIAKLLEKYKGSELITTASTEKEQLVENIATAYMKTFELISSLLNTFSHVSKLSTNELLVKLERVSSNLQEVVADLTTLKESEEIQSALAREPKKFQSKIQSVLEATEDLMALVATLQKTYNEFAETAKISESTTDEVISTNKIGENIQSALLSILEQIRKLNLKMLRTLVKKV